mgnify:CR=1 FL=1
MAMQALEAGKHVVVEKPFTQTVGQANELINKAEQKGVVLSVFQNRRWDGDFLTVQKVIRERSLGQLVSFESHFDRFRNFVQASWKEEDSLGAGTLYNLGSHMIDQALMLFGKPESLFAVIRALRPGSRVDDSFDIFLNYPGVKCFIRGSYLVKEEGPRYILHGVQGSFLKFGIDPQEEALKAGQLPVSKDWGKDTPERYGILHTEVKEKDRREAFPTLPGNYPAYYDNIYEVIRQDAPLAVTPDQAREVIRIIEAAYRSSRMNRVIQL